MKTLECLIEFEKWANLEFFIDWLNTDKDESDRDLKRRYLGECVSVQISQVLEFVFNLKKDAKINGLFLFLSKMQAYLSKPALKIIFNWI